MLAGPHRARAARARHAGRRAATTCGAPDGSGLTSASYAARRDGERPPGTPRVLSIAGSDSGGGAGIQADLKAFARCGVHGMTAITAVTWQNTVAVEGVTPIPPEAIVGQVQGGRRGHRRRRGQDRHARDGRDDRGGRGGARPGRRRAGRARSGDGGRERRAPARAGRARGARRAAAARRRWSRRTSPRRARSSRRPERRPAETPRSSPRAVHALGPRYVVVTGGHARAATRRSTSSSTASSVVEIPGPRYPGGAAHGSGCTHSSALAAQLALGLEPLEAARAAKRIASEAVRDGLRDIGAGAGPVDVLGIAARRRTPCGGPLA